MSRSYDPRTGETFGPEFPDASPGQVEAAAAAAADAAAELAGLAPAEVAALLTAIADRLDAAGELLAATADRETALGRPRLNGELARTTGQLRMFAGLVKSGDHLEAVIDRALAAGGPASDLRRVNVPLGPVVVFGASNFPLAFSVAGGDTASALAAGCPVLAKAHPAHPQTSQHVADLVVEAVAARGLPPGTFQLVHGAAPAIGRALVMHPAVKAVGFTGSTAAGRALFDVGAARPEPIPVYAEMGSLNPVILAPSALHQSSAQHLAAQLSGSVTGGWGQFCTKPGVVLVPTEHIGMFAKALTAALADVQPGHLLTKAIRDAYLSRIAATTEVPGVRLWRGSTADEGWAAPAALGVTDTQTFLTERRLQEEHFGPFVLLVGIRNLAEVDSVLQAIGGTLTGTVHGDPDEQWTAAALRALVPRAGRVLVGGVPTGVAVVPAQMHGGPYPASTAAAHTSVGTAAIRRFLRPIAYQEVPDALLPPALRDDNPWGTRRLVDGYPTTAALSQGTASSFADSVVARATQGMASGAV